MFKNIAYKSVYLFISYTLYESSKGWKPHDTE
jgi:hypothetical protein